MDIEFQGQYEKKQYFEGIYLAGKPSRRSVLMRVVVFLIFLGLYTGMVYTTMQKGGPSGFEMGRIIRHLITLIILAYFIFRPYINRYFTANRLWKDPSIRREITGTVTSLGISYGTHTIEWDRFVSRHESENFVVLMTAERLMVFLPRSFFKDETDWRNFRLLVDQRVKEAK